MKTLLTRTLPLLLCILIGMGLSWLAIYSFWFSTRVFHSVAVMRALDGVSHIVLLPGHCIVRWLGGDQSTLFTDPLPFSGTNGLILGMILYVIFRASLNLRSHAPQPRRDTCEVAKVD